MCDLTAPSPPPRRAIGSMRPDDSRDSNALDE
jgi:hypothetical protein